MSGLNIQLVLSASAIAAMVVFLYMVVRKSERERISRLDISRLGPDKRDTIAMAWAVVIGLTMFSLSDRAIQIPNVTIPYGLIWTWLNPFYWTNEKYKWAILIIQFAVMIPQYYLAKKGKLNWRMLHLLLFSTIYFRLMGVFQEVTPVIFAPFATINPLFSGLLLIQKYPFWSLIPSFSDVHFQCSYLGQCVSYTVDRQIFLHGALNPDIATHALVLFWLVAPVYAWWKKRAREDHFCTLKIGCKMHWNEDRFWTKMMLPMSAIMMFGFVILMFFGCCAGYHWFA